MPLLCFIVWCFLMYSQKLDTVMGHRKKQYAEFRRLIAMRAKYFFIVLLGNRQYRGKMTFSHPKETLDIAVSTILMTTMHHSCLLLMYGKAS